MSIIQSKTYSIAFFGSFQKYSTIILKTLLKNPLYQINAVISTPPHLSGRNKKLKKNHTHSFAQKQGLRIFTPEHLENQPPALTPVDFLIVAGYGKLLPQSWLNFPRIMPINFHPSLLPKYFGRCPVEWALLNQEKETGITFIKMNQVFDRGDILIQKTIPIKKTDTRETLYQKLYTLGAQTLIDILPEIAKGNLKPKPQKGISVPAPQITRQHGYIPWKTLKNFLRKPSKKPPQILLIKLRALNPWPGVWTTTSNQKRLKIISLQPKIIVQPEGQKPTPLNEIKNQLFPN